jgi:hypothetical protein
MSLPCFFTPSPAATHPPPFLFSPSPAPPFHTSPTLHPFSFNPFPPSLSLELSIVDPFCVLLEESSLIFGHFLKVVLLFAFVLLLVSVLAWQAGALLIK